MTTTLPRASKAALTDGYTDFEPLVRQIAARFARRYGRKFDDTLAEANLHFLAAYNGFDPAFGADLEARVQFVVWRRLYDTMRDDAERNGLLKRADTDLDLFAGKPTPTFDRDTLVSGLGESARAVVTLILDTPGDLLDAIRRDPNPGPASTRRCLRRYLRDVMGWAAWEVAVAFTEVGDALGA